MLAGRKDMVGEALTKANKTGSWWWWWWCTVAVAVKGEAANGREGERG